MALASIRARALACSAAFILGASTARAAELEGGAAPAAAGPAATTPKPMTKPKSSEQDGSSVTDGLFEAVATKTGFLAAWNRANPSTFETTLLVQRFGSDGKAIGKPAKIDGPAFIPGLPEFVDLGGDAFGLVWKSSGPSLKSVVIDGKTGKVGKSKTVLASGSASLIHDLAPLPKGKVAMVTRSSASGGEDTTLTILDKTMKPVGAPKLVEDDVTGPFGIGTYEQTVVANDGGGVAIYRASDGQLKGRSFNGAGKLDKPFQINTTTMPSPTFLSQYADFTVKAEPLGNGGYVATWTLLDQGSTTNFNVRARVFDRKGDPVGPDFPVNLDVSGMQRAPEILVSKKGFGIGWTDTSVTPGYTTQMARFFDLDGAALSGDVVTEYFGPDGKGIAIPSTDTEVAALSKGAFVKVFVAAGRLYADGMPAPDFGGAGGETIGGGDAADVIIAAGGADDVTAGAGADTVDGGSGDDTIDGGLGENLILPGEGDDEITAGADAEVFVVAPGQGVDLIADFGPNDRIDVSAFHYNQKSAVLADAAEDGDDLVLTLNGSATPAEAVTVVRLRARGLADFKEANIIY